MEFDRVVFNEEPGAVYGPGAAPMPGASRGRVLRGAEGAPCMQAPHHSLCPHAVPAPAPGAQGTRTRPTCYAVQPTPPPRALRSADRLWQPPDLSALVSARGRHPGQAPGHPPPREVAGGSYFELQHDGVGCLQL